MSIAIALFLRFVAWACFVSGAVTMANTVVRYARSEDSRSIVGGFLGWGEVIRWLLIALMFTVWSLFK